MAYSGQKRYIGIGKETSYATGGSITKYYDVISESIAGDPSNLYMETAGQREKPGVLPGPWKETGTIEMYLDPIVVGEILHAMFGDSAFTSGTSANQHVFAPQETIGSLLVELYPGDIDGNAYTKKLPGTICKSMEVATVAGEICMASLDVVCQTETISGTSAFTGTFDNDILPFVFWQGAVTWDAGSLARVEAIRFTYENGVVEDAFVLESRFLPAIRLEDVKFTGSMDLAFTEWAVYRRIYGGGSTAVSPITDIDNQDLPSLQLVLQGPATGDGTYTNYQLDIFVSGISLDTATANFNKRERIVENIEFEAVLVDSNLTTWTLWNAEDEY